MNDASNQNRQPLEERKLREIEHSRQRRSILQGFERHTDTTETERVNDMDALVRDSDAFKHHFSNMKFYAVAKASEDYYFAWLRKRCNSGVRALDYCCGNGENALFMAKCGADTVGIDISPEGVENARKNALREKVGNVCRFEVMDGENMTFPDNHFDVAVVYGALHHVDFDKAMAELRRVLKPDGEMICVEALRHNPLIHLYRRMTMHLRTAWEVDHILTVQHLDRSQQYFNQVQPRFFHLCVLAAVPFRKTRFFQPLRKFLDRLDGILLKSRALGKYGWIMVFTISKPKKA